MGLVPGPACSAPMCPHGCLPSVCQPAGSSSVPHTAADCPLSAWTGSIALAVLLLSRLLGPCFLGTVPPCRAAVAASSSAAGVVPPASLAQGSHVSSGFCSDLGLLTVLGRNSECLLQNQTVSLSVQPDLRVVTLGKNVGNAVVLLGPFFDGCLPPAIGASQTQGDGLSGQSVVLRVGFLCSRCEHVPSVCGFGAGRRGDPRSYPQLFLF